MSILLPLLAAAAPAPAPAPPSAPPPSPSAIVAAAPAADWRAIVDDALLVMTLADGRQVTIQLAPGFAPRHVAAVRRLAAGHWWDAGASIYRVQDNYVAQWGDATNTRPLPAGMADDLPGEYVRPLDFAILRTHSRDAYAARVGFSPDGWPVASDGRTAWLPHCYGYVGVGRDLAPSTGNGAELYAVIGHAPRHLDRNIAVVGRVVEGIAVLSSLPRGTGGALGMYEKPAQYVPIASIRLASELPAAERPRFEYLAPASNAFARYVVARENREPPFFERPAGGADLCNIPVLVRRVPAG